MKDLVSEIKHRRKFIILENILEKCKVDPYYKNFYVYREEETEITLFFYSSSGRLFIYYDRFIVVGLKPPYLSEKEIIHYISERYDFYEN